MSLLRLHSTRSTARLKAVQQTFRPVSSSLLEQNRRSFASTPESAHQSPPPPSSSSKSTSRSQPKPKTAIPPQSQSSSVSRDQQQTSASRLASSPDSRTAATSEEGGSNGGGDEPFYTADNYIKPTLHVFGTFRKLLVYTSAASVSIAVLVFLGFEGTHLYVEHVSIAPTLGTDDGDGPEEDAVWGWATESQESWTGGRRGGTDPVLGYRARHLIRAAWMAQNWGAGVGGPLQSARNKSDGSATVFNVTAYLASSQFLDQAVALARQNPKVFPQDHHQGLSNAALDLLLLRSRVLERIGTPRSITVARDDLLQIWEDGSVSANRQR
ncbi:hypothetical protein FRB90_001071 [Tulasnella sp. 427]|nr:hypothetical protein FRB90_001071 [Tulasnella sp. 427]